MAYERATLDWFDQLPPQIRGTSAVDAEDIADGALTASAPTNRANSSSTERQTTGLVRANGHV